MTHRGLERPGGKFFTLGEERERKGRKEEEEEEEEMRREGGMVLSQFLPTMRDMIATGPTASCLDVPRRA